MKRLQLCNCGPNIAGMARSYEERFSVLKNYHRLFEDIVVVGDKTIRLDKDQLILGTGHADDWVTVGNHRRHGPLLRPQTRPGHQALRKGRVSLANHVYLVTATTLNRQCFFVDFDASCAAARCFENGDVLGDARVLAWVLMPDHAHWLIHLGDQDNLSIVVNRLKSSSSRLANRKLDRRGALWEPGCHDHCLRAEENLLAIARYIVANPLRAGLAKRVGDYPFWNAVWI